MSIASIESVGLAFLGALAPSGAAAVGQARPVSGAAPAQSCDCGKPECPICGPASGAAAVEDQLELSPAAQKLLAASSPESASSPAEKPAASAPAASPSSKSANGSGELTTEEQAEVEELEQADREVRAHEQAHMAAAGGLSTSGASFEYKTGPDGRSYAVAGEVSIDISTVSDDPEATIRKMEQVRAAAMAPADPSAQDHAVAAQALQIIQQARE